MYKPDSLAPSKITMHFNVRVVFIFLCILSLITVLAYRIILIYSHKPDLGGVENSVVYFIQRTLDGYPLYTNPELPPYAINQYPPLYYYIAAFFAKISGVHPEQVIRVFMVNRTAGLVLNLLYVLMVYLTSRHIFLITRSKTLVIILFCFIFLSAPSFARPDSLNLFVFYLVLYTFFTYIKKQKNKTLLLALSAFLCVIAFYSKQTSLSLPLLIGGWLILQKNLKMQYGSLFYMDFFWSCSGYFSFTFWMVFLYQYYKRYRQWF